MSNFLASNLRLVVEGEAAARELCEQPAQELCEQSVQESILDVSDLEESERPARRKEERLHLPEGFDRLLQGQWRIESLLGSGTFGKVYEAVSTTTGKRIAVKVEDLGQRLLPYEAKIYDILNARGPQAQMTRGQRFFAKKEWFAVVNGCNCLAFELLGKSVETIMMAEGKRIMFKDVLMLGMQMLEALCFMHSRHMIHRDIKPDNIVSGLGEKKNIFCLIDFGLSKQYRDPKTLVHNPYKENKSLTGTPRYASINNHMGVEQSRRDDLESLAYSLIYLCKGELPWQGIKMPKNVKDTRKYKNRKILESKMSTPVQELCFGIPRCMQDFLFYVRSLRFQDKPKYQEWIDAFGEAILAMGLQVDWQFSWLRD